MRSVTASEANRQFSSLLRDVAAGETVVVTSHGRPVAKLSPADEPLARDVSDADAQAWREIFERVGRTRALGLPRESREDIYHRDR